MVQIPSRLFDKLSNGLKKFQPILSNARTRDINESDTVVIITDILHEIFGYDKYSEITSEYAIRGSYCDLATKIDGKLQFLIEVKAIGIELKDSHTKQAVDYAANQGCDWVILTNGIIWKVYKVLFAKPIDQELVVEFDVTGLDYKNSEHLEKLFFISKEGWIKSLLGVYHNQKQVLSRFFIGAVIMSEPVLESIKKELRKISPDIRIEKDQIKNVIIQEIIKRDVLEGEKAKDSEKKIQKFYSKIQRAKAKNKVNKIKEEFNQEENNSDNLDELDSPVDSEDTSLV